MSDLGVQTCLVCHIESYCYPQDVAYGSYSFLVIRVQWPLCCRTKDNVKLTNSQEKLSDYVTTIIYLYFDAVAQLFCTKNSAKLNMQGLYALMQQCHNIYSINVLAFYSLCNWWPEFINCNKTICSLSVTVYMLQITWCWQDNDHGLPTLAEQKTRKLP